MSSHQNNGYSLPDPLTGYDLVCLEMQIPDNQLYRAAIVGAITTLTKWWNWERTGDNSGSIAAHYWLDLVLTTLKIGGCTPDNLPPITPDNAAGGADFDRFLELLLELDMKFETPDGKIYEPVIPLRECGCGSGDGTGAGSGATPGATLPGSTPGDVYGSDVTTLCDVLTTGVPWILDAVDDTLDALQSKLLVLDPLIPDEALNMILGLDVGDILTNTETSLTDPDFIEDFQDIVAKHFNDPVQPNFNRLALVNFAYKMPIVWGGGSPRAAWLAWAWSQNLQIFNAQVQSWSGTGDYSATCEAVEQRVGRPLYNPSNNVPDLNDEFITEDASGTYTTRVFAMGTPFQRITETPALAPFDYSNKNLVMSGLTLTDIDNLFGNSPAPAFFTQNNASLWWTAPISDFTGVSEYHAYGYQPSGVPAAIRSEIVQRVVTRVGLPVDDIVVTGEKNPTLPNVTMGAGDIDGGSATVAFLWIVDFVAAT